MTYPEYYVSSQCRKCDFYNDHYTEYESERVGKADGTVVVMGEWLLRTCKNCRYSWREAVLNPGDPE